MSVRSIALTACVVLASLVGAGCSQPPPVASNAVPPPVQADTEPVVWAALGGDETLAFDQASTPGSWTQRVLSRLPVSAQLLNLATEDATLQVGGTSQLDALRASPVKPTVATVWFGTAEPNTSKGQFVDGLTNLVNGLEDLGVQRVVLISRPGAPGGPGDRGYRYGAEIKAVAAATGATAVEVTALTNNPGDPAAQASIADQLAPSISAG